MPTDPPQDWPPPIYIKSVVAAKAPDPRKVARHHVALGWIFIVLAPLAPPVFLPYALFYGGQAWRGGEAAHGQGILASAALMAAGFAWLLVRR